MGRRSVRSDAGDITCPRKNRMQRRCPFLSGTVCSTTEFCARVDAKTGNLPELVLHGRSGNLIDTTAAKPAMNISTSKGKTLTRFVGTKAGNIRRPRCEDYLAWCKRHGEFPCRAGPSTSARRSHRTAARARDSSAQASRNSTPAIAMQSASRSWRNRTKLSQSESKARLCPAARSLPA